MVMAAVGHVDAGAHHDHIVETELHLQRQRHGGAVYRRYDVSLGVGWGGMTRARCGRHGWGRRRGCRGRGWGRSGRGVGDGHVNEFGHDRRGMRNVIPVTQQKLQRVRSGRQSKVDLGLTSAEMHMIGIVRNGFVERRQLSVDQQMMVTGIGFVRTGRRNAHSTQAEMYRRRRADDCAVLQVNEINLGPFRRRGRAARRLRLCER